MAARRVLVIEDDPGARDALGCLLADEGYDVHTAASGRGGLDCVGDFRPDTIVCDFFLPDIDGLEVLRSLRRLYPEVYFIALTANCGDGDAERALRREADLFLSKPIDLLRFRAELARARPTDPHPGSPLNA